MAQLLRCGLEPWIAPSDHVRHLKVLQKRRCLATGERLLKNAEVDHHVPLFRVWHDYHDRPWPALLAFWGVPNLQVINRSAHVEKCAQEAGERTQEYSKLVAADAGSRMWPRIAQPTILRVKRSSTTAR